MYSNRITTYYGNLPDPYSQEFPTRWSWEDHEEEMKKSIHDFEMKKKEKKEKDSLLRKERKAKKQILIESIKVKLTKEELSVIGFKK